MYHVIRRQKMEVSGKLIHEKFMSLWWDAPVSWQWRCPCLLFLPLSLFVPLSSLFYLTLVGSIPFLYQETVLRYNITTLVLYFYLRNLSKRMLPLPAESVRTKMTLQEWKFPSAKGVCIMRFFEVETGSSWGSQGWSPVPNLWIAGTWDCTAPSCIP